MKLDFFDSNLSVNETLDYYMSVLDILCMN